MMMKPKIRKKSQLLRVDILTDSCLHVCNKACYAGQRS